MSDRIRPHGAGSRRFVVPSLTVTLTVACIAGAAMLAMRSSAAGIAPSIIVDFDNDGLSDAFESYLLQASSDPKMLAMPFNADSDGDGQPDGFEYCLSNRTSVFSPTKQYSVVPKLTLGSYQSGDDLYLTLYVVPGAVSLFDDFKMMIAAPTSTGNTIVDMTPLLGQAVDAVHVTAWGAYSMAIFQFKVPVSVIRNYETVAFAALAKFGPYGIGDSANFTVHDGHVVRWTYLKKTGTNDQYAGIGEPQESTLPAGWVENEVCGSVDIQEPTNTPGMLQSLVQSMGCGSGTWSCNAGLCSLDSSEGKPKLVLDADLLLGPPNP